MIRLYSPENEGELAVARSLLDAEGIRYHVLNDHFGTLRIGPKIDLFNAKVVCVQEKDVETAKELLIDFLGRTEKNVAPFESGYSVFDKIRMVVETLLFGWFIPGSRWRRKKRDHDRREPLR